MRSLIAPLFLASSCLWAGGASVPLAAAPLQSSVSPAPPAPPAANAPRRRASAVRVPNGTVHVDGRLDEREWLAPPPAAGFVQQQPKEGAPSSEPSEVRFLYDDDNLYIGGRLTDGEPDKLVVSELKRDFNARDGDLFVVVFDTFHDRRNSYGFQTNPMGALRDTQHYDDGRSINANWDAVWSLKTSVDADGWMVEAAIPFKSLRFPEMEEQIWGLQLFRLIRRKNEPTMWNPVPRQFNQFKVSFAGELDGIRDVRPGRNVRVKPFGIAALRHRNRADDLDWDGGVDVKVGLGTNLVLDGTFRTDFSQVEADEQQVNLTRFNLFFPEKREFFLENQGAFQIGPPQQSGSNLIPFFSRTIGLSDAGTPIPIVGGARLSGKVGRSTVGLLNIQTEEEVLASGVRRPASNFSVARFAQEFGSNSSASVFYMGKERAEGSNRLVGGDVRYNLTRNVGFDAMIMRSEKTDVGTGTAWRAGFDADSNLSRVAVSYASLGDTFRDDLGFLPRLGVDILDATVTRRIRPRTGSRLIREWRPELPYTRISRDGFGIQTATISPTLSVDFADGASASYRFRRNEEGLAAPFRIRSDYSIPVGRYTFDDHNVEFSGSRARRLSATGAVRFGDFYDGTREGFTLGGRFRFSPKLAVSLSYGRDFVSLPRLDFTTDLFSLRLDQSFSTRMFLNAFIQYNSVTREVISNVRFNVIHHPLSDLFVVYNETRSRSGALPSRSVVVKLTHLLSF